MIKSLLTDVAAASRSTFPRLKKKSPSSSPRPRSKIPDRQRSRVRRVRPTALKAQTPSYGMEGTGDVRCQRSIIEGDIERGRGHKENLQAAPYTNSFACVQVQSCDAYIRCLQLR
jgi:hypothetical protein